MWGAIAAAALGIASSIFGSKSSSDASQKANDYIEEEEKENENWYNRRYNEDVTQRADAQRALTQAEESIKNRNRAAAGQQAVMGGTEESTAATKAANAKTLSDATSQIAAQGEARKDKIEEQYRTTKSNLANQKVNVENARAQNVANATSGALNAAANIAAADFAFGNSGTRAATGTADANSGSATGATSAAKAPEQSTAASASTPVVSAAQTRPTQYESIFDQAEDANNDEYYYGKNGNLNKVIW